MEHNRIKRFNENLKKDIFYFDVSDSSKIIAVDFAKWIADNKWYKQIRYDVWEKSGFGSKSTSDLFDMFIDNLNNK